MDSEEIHCQCGGRLYRPIPNKCPHCGAEIVLVERFWWPRIWPLLAIALLFATLFAFTLWYVGRLAE